MIPKIYKEEVTITRPRRLVTNVLITLPFEPLSMSKSAIDNRLKEIIYKLELQVYTLFSDKVAEDILERLLSLIGNLNYTSNKKSVTIYLSENIERVYYLNTILKEEIIVGKPFTIRDIFRNEEQNKKYLLMVLTSHSTRFFEGNDSHLSLRAVNLPDQVATYADCEADTDLNSENFLAKFIKHSDEVLSILLRSTTAPLIIMCTSEVKKLFLKVSGNKRTVIQFIDIPSNDITEEEISSLLKPLIDSWKTIRTKHIIQQIELAVVNNKLVGGIEEVWKSARHCRSKSLFIENNYVLPAYFGDNASLPYGKNIVAKRSAHLRDAADDAIENVLKDGGDIYIVDEGVLNDYLHIALIKH